jgi:hypothetical protein
MFRALVTEADACGPSDVAGKGTALQFFERMGLQLGERRRTG